MKESTIYISKENLLHNHTKLTALAGVPVWPVLKSNAYGHGLREVTEILLNTDFEYFIVQNYFEAEQIWKTKSGQQILMLGTDPFELYDSMDFSKTTPTIGSIELLEHIMKLEKKISVHLKINTGMNRQGFDPEQIPQVITVLKENTQIEVTGILTHFSDADGPDNSFTHKQYMCFISCINEFKKSGITPIWIHAGNSAGLSKTRPGILNAARSGIALYGLNPLEESDKNYSHYEELKPVLSFHTHITHMRSIKTGEFVGYGNTYSASRVTRVATIPVGYYEGIPRLMSNVGVCSTEVKDILPIVGRVSMNLITLDVTGADLSVGDEVIVYSKNKLDPNTVTKNAFFSNTLHYELTTNLKPHIKRTIV